MPVATLKCTSIYNLFAAADQVKSAMHCMGRCHAHPCVLVSSGPSSPMPCLTSPLPNHPYPTSSPGAWRCQQWHPGAKPQVLVTRASCLACSGMQACAGRGGCWLHAADTASSALLPIFFGKWHLRMGVFCPGKWWLKLEQETTALCMHAASCSSAVLGFWKFLVLVGSFHFLYLPSFRARKSCWLEGCRCTGICC